MVGKGDQASYSRLKIQDWREREEKCRETIRKIGWNIKPVAPYVFPQVFDLSGLCLMKLRSIGKNITSLNILKINPLPPLLPYFLPSLTHTSHHLWTTCHCSHVGEWGLSGCLSLSCFDCLSTAPRLCSIFGTQTLKWNGMSENPGCLYNKEHVASLGNNETRWIAIQFFVVLPTLDKAKIWPNVESGYLFCSHYWNG